MSKRALISPAIPAAAFDGLILAEDLDRDIEVILESWAYAHEGDTFQLLIDGKLVGSAQKLTSPVPPQGAKLTLYLPKEELIQEGRYRITYRVTNVLGGQSAESTSTTIRVDRTAPGAALLAPLIFPKTTCGEQRIALLPGYAGMEPGDTIATLCNGVSGPRHVVQPDELTVRPIEIVFDHEHLQSLAAESVVIVYTVTDRAGNESIESEPTTLLLTS